MEWVRYGEIRRNADMYCSLCSNTVDSDEFVLANTNLLPIPWICRDCAEEVGELLEFYPED